MNFLRNLSLKAVFLPALLVVSCSVHALAPKAPSGLRSCDKPHPSGTDNRPYFGWLINDPDNNEIQTAYQVQVFSAAGKAATGKADVWESGKVISGSQNYNFIKGTVAPATRYFWRVRTWDKDGNVSPYSLLSWFDTGLFGNADWSGAKWIKRNSSDPDDYTYFRKNLKISSKAIKRATAYVSACHEYELYVSGKFVAKGSVYHYPEFAYYHTYDITGSVKSGTTTNLSLLTHWFGGGQGRAPGSRGLIAKIVVEYNDGTRTVTGTDASWKQKRNDEWVAGQPRRNGEGVGFVDRIDSRNALPGWNTVGFDDSGWDAAVEIGAPPVAPWTGTLQTDLTRVIEKEIRPASVKSLGGNNYLVDLGKVYAGMPRISFTGGTAGEVVNIHGGYLLNDDGKSINPRSNQGTNLNYFFILNGKGAVFAPKVYFGYRYLLIENSPNVLTPANVSFISRHYELDRSRASFASSDDMLNQVWELMIHSLLVCAHENYVDTPTREKGAFLGDGGYQGVPSMTAMGERIYNHRALLEFLDSQDQYWPDGRINAVYPSSDGKRDIPDYTQGYLLWAWDYFLLSGNMDFLKENYTKFRKIGEYVDAYRNKLTGLIDKLAGGGGGYVYGIIDWPSRMRYGYDMTADSRTVIDALAYIDYDIIAKMADVLGNTADKEAYLLKAAAMKAAINAKLITKEGVYADGLKNDGTQSAHISQHANMFPLAAGIVPDQHRQTVIDAVKERKMSVGMVTLRMLPEALGQANQGAHLLELYTNPAWDGWAQTISLGGTTTWEEWRAHTTTNSMSHAWGSIGLLGIQNYILGVTVLKPQHELIQVKPLDFEGKLKQAKGVFPTDRGNISVSWNRDGNRFLMTLTLPDNVKANVYVPMSGAAGTKVMVDGKAVTGQVEGTFLNVGKIGSGVHTFERVL